jgi:sarcosine oxidase subunit gamma
MAEVALIERDQPLAGRVLAVRDEVTIAPLAPGARFVLRCSPEDTARIAAAFRAPMPTAIGAVGIAGSRAALALGPDEWLLFAEDGAQVEIEAALATLAGRAVFALVEVSDRNGGVSLTGAAATDVLAANCPFDVASLPVGGCTRTVFAKCEIVLWRQSDMVFRLEFSRSYAAYVWRLLELACAELGLPTPA